MTVCCVFTLESTHRGDSNEYTQYTIFNMNRKNALNYPKSAAMGFFSKGQNKFETADVNEPSVFEPLKFYCINKTIHTLKMTCSVPLQMQDSGQYSFNTEFIEIWIL